MKIIIITSYFPSFDLQRDSPRTKFLYYYAVEWTKMGHEVLILHSVPRYPLFFIEIISFLKKILNHKNFIMEQYSHNYEATKPAQYYIDGIRVIRTPIRKIIPHKEFLPWDLLWHKYKVIKQLKEINFKSDLVISDFLTENLEHKTFIQGMRFLCETFNQVTGHTNIEVTENGQTRKLNVKTAQEGTKGLRCELVTRNLEEQEPLTDIGV